MESPAPGIPNFCMEYISFFVKSSVQDAAAGLGTLLGYEIVGDGFGMQRASASERTLRLIRFHGSEWTAIVPVVLVPGSIYLDDNELTTNLSRSLKTNCVGLGIYDTAGGLTYKLACDGKLIEELIDGEDEADDECRFSPQSHPSYLYAKQHPYEFLDQTFKELGIILPLLKIQYEEEGDLLLPVEDVVWQHRGIETALVLEPGPDSK